MHCADKRFSGRLPVKLFSLASTMTAEKPFAKYGVRELYGHKKKVYSMAWNCSGRKLATGSPDTMACIWVVEPDGRVRKDVPDLTLSGHKDAVEHMVWDPVHENRLATTSSDKTLRIWDARTGKDVCRISTPGVNIFMTWHPSGHHLAVGNKEDVIAVFDMRRVGKPIRTHKNSHEVNEIAFSNDGKYFMQTAAATNSLEIYSYPSFELTQTLRGHTATPYALGLDPTNKYLATGGLDGVACLWDATHLACVRTYTMRNTPVRSLSFSHDGRYLAVASEQIEAARTQDGAIGGQPYMLDIHDVHTGRPAHTIEARPKQILDTVRWNPKHPILAFPGTSEDHRERDTYGAVCLFAPRS